MRSLKMISTWLTLVLALTLSACAQRGHGPANSGSGQTGGGGGNPATPGQAQTSSPTGTPSGGIVEGTINGGGGRGMLCKVNGVEKLMALDLWEAESVGLKLLEEPKTEEEAMDLALTLYARHMWNPWSLDLAKFKEIIKSMLDKEFTSKFSYLPKGKTLKLVNDSHEVISQEGCTPVQIAVYVEDRLMIDGALWAKLSNLNKAAMWMHELIYYGERMEGRTNSITTRILVGQMFSTKGARPRADGVPLNEKERFACSFRDGSVDAGEAFVYVAEEHGQRGLEMVFTNLKTATSVMRSSAFFYGLSVRDLRPGAEIVNQSSVSLRVDSQASDVELALITKDGALMMNVLHRKTNKDLTLTMNCRIPEEYRPVMPSKEPPQPEKRVELPPGPPKIPESVLMISRYGGLGDYETTATYNFRYMTHDTKITRNNWDMIFEARSDFAKDMFQANTVTDDDSFIFTLKSGSKGCKAVNPCEIEQGLKLSEEKTGRRKNAINEFDRAEVSVGQCYLLVSQDSSGEINVTFEVKEHVKSASVSIGEIKIIPKTKHGRPECVGFTKQ